MPEGVMLDAALSYIARGWSIIPAHSPTTSTCSCSRPTCSSPGKHPRVEWAAWQLRQPDEAQVRAWWLRWPDANIAIITGAVSELVVLDVDPRHGGDEALRDLGALPATVTALTGGGGQHLFFQHPGEPVPNAATQAGLDLRGDGGYVIAPPSMHMSGNRYTWEDSSGPDEVPLAPLPAHVRTLGPSANAPSAIRRGGPVDIEELIRDGIPEGARNDTLTRIAGSLAADTPDEGTILQVLDYVNRRGTLGKPLPDAEVVTIARSICARERAARAGREADLARVAGQSETMRVLPGDERLQLARQVWSQYQIICTDWLVLMSSEPEYVLSTPAGAVSFPDILNYTTVRRKVLNHLGILTPLMKAAAWEPVAAHLRQLAREESVTSSNPADQVEEWLEAYASANGGVKEAELSRRRDQLVRGPVLYESQMAFRLSAFRSFVESDFGERLTPLQVASLLKRAGAHSAKVRVTEKGDQARVWLIDPPTVAEAGKEGEAP